MFLLNGQPLAIDTPFTTEDGTQYPANWLRLSSEDERTALGITEEADPATYDDRFYWGVGNPKDLAGLKSQWTNTIDQAAWQILNPTDYMDSRTANDDEFVPPSEWITWRASIRATAKSVKLAINSTETVEALIPLTQVQWPSDPNNV